MSDLETEIFLKNFETEAVRSDMLAYVRGVRSAMAIGDNRLVSQACDKDAIPCFRDYSTETGVLLMDHCIDQYIVEPRVPLATIRSRWALHMLSDDVYCTWIDDKGLVSTAYHTGLYMHTVFSDRYTSDEYIRNYGLWPIRKDFISDPLSANLREAAPRTTGGPRDTD